MVSSHNGATDINTRNTASHRHGHDVFSPLLGFVSVQRASQRPLHHFLFRYSTLQIKVK